MPFGAAFKRRRNGSLQVSFHRDEAEVLVLVLQNLRAVAADPRAAGPVGKRLYPRAYLDPTEERAEAQFRGDVHGELVAARIAAIDGVLDALAARRDATVKIAPEAEQQWLTVLNDARLVIGTEADVTEDLDLEALDLAPDDPRLQDLIVYAWLTELQHDLVMVLADDLPDIPDDPT